MTGCELSFDPDRLQLEVIHAFLSSSYWSPGISLERVRKAFANSLVVGAYTSSGEQVGCARMVTDRARFAYLADVFVHEAYRGRGLGRAMTTALLEHPDIQDLRWILLATRDAHGVYAACGFQPIDDPHRLMQIRRPTT
jgi:N-acetylglutamate synthase-like GNAT family acetyltransferase